MDQTEHLDITVTAEEARLIREKIESGAYSSTSAVFRAALRALEKDDAQHQLRLAELKRKIQAAIDDPRPTYTSAEVGAHMDRLFEKALRDEKARSGGNGAA